MKNFLDKAIVPISLLLANIANFIIQIIIPRNLSPSEYSKFTLSWSAGLFISALFFEWIRVFLIRYGQDGNKGFTVFHKNTIVGLYKKISIFLLLIFFVLWVFFDNYSLFWISGALFFAIFKGVFDGLQASDRANFRNQSFAQRWLLSSIIGLVSCLSVSYFTGIGNLSLIALSISFPIAILVLNLKYLKQVLLNKKIDKKITKFVCDYGIFLSVSTLIMSLFPFLLRLILINKVGENNVAGLLLALEISGKTVMSCGMFLNILLLQYVIKKVDSNQENAGRFMSMQVMITSAVLLPASMILFELFKYFSIYIAPTGYIVGYLKYLDIAFIFSLLITLKLYAIDSLFAISGKTSYSLVGSLSMIFVVGFIYFISYRNIYFLDFFIMLPVVIGLLLSILCASFFTQIKWDLKNLISISMASFLMFFSLNRFFLKSSLFDLFVAVLFSFILYFFVIFIFNINLLSKNKFR